MLPAWLLSQIFAAKVVRRTEVTALAECQSGERTQSSLPLPRGDASIGEERVWHIVSPVGMVIYFCILIHNSIITDLRQYENYFASWVVKINCAHCVFIQ